MRLPTAMILLSWMPLLAAAPAPVVEWTYDDADLSLKLRARSPDQITAFYTARKFPKAMIDLLRGLCFITTRVGNNSDDILWLDLKRWHFSSADGAIERRDRAWLARQLDTIEAPAAARSTLRWTLLPERLGYRPGESEGGNLLLPRIDGPFRLDATFARGADGSGGETQLHIEGLRCAQDAP